jgi:transposase
MNSEAVLGVWGYEITSIEHRAGAVRIQARYSGAVACPDCSGEQLRSKGRYLRRVRHESWGMRHCFLILEARKWVCRACGRGFRQQFPGILKWQRASEAFRRMIFFRHWDGISRRRLGQREGLGSATIERWFQYVLKRLAAERRSSRPPRYAI